jgi:hypothetical protein
VYSKAAGEISTDIQGDITHGRSQSDTALESIDLHNQLDA